MHMVILVSALFSLFFGCQVEKTEIVTLDYHSTSIQSDSGLNDQKAVESLTVSTTNSEIAVESKETDVLGKEEDVTAEHVNLAKKSHEVQGDEPITAGNGSSQPNEVVPESPANPLKEVPETIQDKKEEAVIEEEISASDVILIESHEKFDELLRKYVNPSGSVDYKGFKREVSKLNDYIGQLESSPPQSTWSREKQMAYWINAYNALTIQMIVKNYPVTSITKLHNGKPWDVGVISIDGAKKSLNDIEHKILRPVYGDARIHFAVNCAAKSCPKIHNEAWTEENLEANLNKLTRSFLNNREANELSPSSLKLSKIFEWYREDFQNLPEFISKHSDIKVKPNAKISFKEYDWALNEN